MTSIMNVTICLRIQLTYVRFLAHFFDPRVLQLKRHRVQDQVYLGPDMGTRKYLIWKKKYFGLFLLFSFYLK